MRPTMLVPIAFLFIGAACCLLIKRRARTPEAAAEQRVGEASAAVADAPTAAPAS
jgi:hypothetical protein